MSTGESARPLAVAARAPAPESSRLALQRKCACGGGGATGAFTGECDDCQNNRLGRSAVVASPLDSPGQPLDDSTRSAMEARFGHDFANVRIHTDAVAAKSAAEAGALAFTAGSHVVFGAGQYAPHTRSGRRLLAHELTHTIQQRPFVSLQRQEAAASATRDVAEAEADRVADQVVSGFIVDDDGAQAGPDQMRKTEFLDELQRSACAAADAELARAGRSTEGCPFVEQAFSRYRALPPQRVEQAIRRYVDTAGVSSARDYIPRVTRRVATGVARWAETGDMSGVPPELAAGAAGGEGILGMLGGGLAGLVGGIGRLLFKRAGSAEATDEDLLHARAHLGEGASLEGGVQARMESAFGADFSSVRIHTDQRASVASSHLAARAFTIGTDIAFGAGEYRPNTLVGDALIAHELAHVVQQSGGIETKGAAGSALDDDADRSAVGAVLAIWAGVKDVAGSAIPRLRSGLRLQACNGSKEHRGELPQGTVEARAGTWRMELEYKGTGADTHRWLQFAWAEAIAETPGGERRVLLSFFSSALVKAGNMETTMDPLEPNWILDATPQSEPFYPGDPSAKEGSALMGDFPTGPPDFGNRIYGLVPEATESRLVQHMESYLMEGASIRPVPGGLGLPYGIGKAVYRVDWIATTRYDRNGNPEEPEYEVLGGGRVVGLSTPHLKLLDARYLRGHHELR
jgi:hypothetical protein